MSSSPQAMAAMLAQGLGNTNQQQSGGQNAGALGFAGQLAQKLALMKALQGGAPSPQGQPLPLASQVPPGQMMPQQMNQNPIPGVGVNA